MIQSHPYLFYAILVAAFIVTRIPILGKFFCGLDTLVHEVGHAFMAMLLQGEVLSIELYKDTSGVAVTRTSSKIKQFMVSIAGYPFSSGMSVVFFYLIKHEYILTLLLVFGSMSIVTLILWIRNWYGFFWLLIFLAILGVTFKYGDDLIRFSVCVFLSAMMLFDSIVKCFIVLYLSVKSSKDSGDAYNLKQLTYIPAFFWGLLFTAFSFFCLYLIITLFFRLPFGF